MIRWGPGFYRVYGEENVPPTGKERRIPLRCPICGIHTDAPIVCTHVTQQNDFVRLPSSYMALYNYLVRCTRCNSGLLVVWSYGEEPPAGGGHTAGSLVLPLRASAFETDRIAVDAVPAAILEDLRQGELAFYAGAHYGAGLLLRRACQNIARHWQIPEDGGLRAQIEAMAAQGIITKSLADMAEGIRVIGNELAHPDPNTPSVITADDVRLAREFLEQMVRAIYVDPARAKKLKDDLKKKGVE